MNPTTAQPAAPQDAGVQPSTRFLAAAVGVFVIVSSALGKPHPGGSGRALGITIALIAFAVSMLAIMTMFGRSARVQLFLLSALIVSSATLVALRPHGVAFLGLFPAVTASALRLPSRTSIAVAALAVAALAIAYAIARNQPAYGIVLNEIGVIAFYTISMFARRMRESNEQTKLLLAEIEQTRTAQAQAAALAERQRLAREMHDVLAHTLSGLVLNLEGAKLLAGKAESHSAVTDAIERANQLAKTGLQEAKRAIGMLRDDELPGPDRLASLTEEFEASTGITCTLDVDGEEHDLSSDGRLTLYRVAQEAMTNIRKHALAERVDVRLVYEASGTRLTIEDFEKSGGRPASGDGTGYGLTGMRERAELLGGTLRAGPTPGGFKVELWVPA
jgi:signal transduction histidine kinase